MNKPDPSGNERTVVILRSLSHETELKEVKNFNSGDELISSGPGVERYVVLFLVIVAFYFRRETR